MSNHTHPPDRAHQGGGAGETGSAVIHGKEAQLSAWQPKKPPKARATRKQFRDFSRGVIVPVLQAAHTSSGVLGPFCF